MKNLLTSIILLVTLSSCAQEKKCSDFKTGEFRYIKENMPETIIRTDTMQIETNPNNKIVVMTSIEWTSDCEYVMTYTDILNYPNDKSGILGKKIYCEIVETNENRVKVHAKSDTIDDILEFIKVD